MDGISALLLALATGTILGFIGFIISASSGLVFLRFEIDRPTRARSTKSVTL